MLSDQLRCQSVGLRGYAQKFPLLLNTAVEGFLSLFRMFQSINDWRCSRTMQMKAHHQKEREHSSQRATTMAEKNIAAQTVRSVLKLIAILIFLVKRRLVSLRFW